MSGPIDSKMKIGHLYPLTHQPIASKKLETTQQQPGLFQKMLDDSLLKFSNHAETRLKQRGIVLRPESINKISGAIDAAAQKGAKDSLIVYQDIAFIVNVPSRTVVTALEGKQMQSNVFTQIDSAIILS